MLGAVCVMKRVGNKIQQGITISMFYAMIISHFSYCVPVWDTSITCDEMLRLRIAQNQNDFRTKSRTFAN